MQNLLTYAIAAAVTFKILSLWNYALCEIVPLPETVFKIICQNTSHYHHTDLDVIIVSKFLSLQGICF
jgi:hypothetical protein